MKTGTRPEIAVTTPNAKLRISVAELIADYRLAVHSRAASELSRREVLVGNAPFGISGEGKEIAQLAMAKAFRPGDWRSGYYRDQTFMFAVGLADLSQYFAQLYADPDVARDPISALLRGFERADGGAGYDLYTVKGHDYLACCDVYQLAAARARREHVPAVVHVTEMTQPQGHSTSGSHERYKSKERLRFETEFDCVARMRDWVIESGIASESQLEGWEAADKEAVEAARDLAWEAFQSPIRAERDRAVAILRRVDMPEVAEITNSLDEAVKVTRSLIMSSAKRALHQLRGLEAPARDELAKFVRDYGRENDERYNSHLYSSSPDSPLNVPVVGAAYSDQSPTVDGRQVLVRNFDANFARDPRIFVIGEDIGRVGDGHPPFEG